MSIHRYQNILGKEPDVLTVRDVSRILRIGKNKAYEIIHNGELPAIKIGNKLLIPKTVLIDFLGNEKKYLPVNSDISKGEK